MIYDQASTTLGSSDSPLSVLVRLIGEQASEKMLKRMPMLLVGGIEALRSELGGSELGREKILAPEPQKFFPTDGQSSSSPSSLSSSPNSKNPFLNGISTASSSAGTPPSDARQSWSSRSRIDNGTAQNGHRPQLSLDQSPRHSRCV